MNDPNDHRSVSSYIFLLANGAIMWCSHKQHTMAKLSMEAEYMVASLVASEIMWLHHFLEEFSTLAQIGTMLYINNHSMIDSTKSHLLHRCTKHINVHYHYICEHIATGKITATHCPSEENVANGFTKVLPCPAYVKYWHMIVMGNLGILHNTKFSNFIPHNIGPHMTLRPLDNQLTQA